MQKAAQSLFDIVFPKSLRVQAGLTDAEANVIYNLWKGSPAGVTQFVLPEDVDRRLVNALKVKGYLAGISSGLELTERGKKVIVEMVTHEPNSFEKHANEISYNALKNKSASRPRQSLVKKQASRNKKAEPKVFNLRLESIKRMSQNENNDQQ